MIPNEAILADWRRSGGKSCGVVLRVDDEETHQDFIRSREKHNSKGVAHYLGNLDRIREIQKRMVSDAEDSGWLSIDTSTAEDPIGLIEDSFK